MQVVDIIIHAENIITGKMPIHVLKNHALIINNNLIINIVPSAEADKIYNSHNKISYNHHVILPGLINSHTHSAMTLFRGLADDVELITWLQNYIWPAETAWVSNDFVYDGTRLAIAEMIRSGTTCFNDMYFFMNTTARAAEEAGIRAHVGMGIIDLATKWAQTPEEYFAKSLEFYECYKNSNLVTPTLAPHSVYTVSPKNLEKINLLAHDKNLKINIHLQESVEEIKISQEKYQKRPLELLQELAMLSPQLIAIHMTQISNSDLKILERTKPHIVHCPESNLKLNSGLCPVQILAEANINVALGTDGAASNNDLDLFGEMRTAAFIGKFAANNPKAMRAEYLLQMATINGAQALGIDHIVGTIEPKKSADFIAVDMNTIETQPLYHPISQLIYAAGRQHVTDVWVAGKQLLKNRELITLDEQEILSKARRWREKISDNFI
jgi:5-methylthioadenosine/S-adenosylhomocysteine deaminase